MRHMVPAGTLVVPSGIVLYYSVVGRNSLVLYNTYRSVAVAVAAGAPGPPRPHTCKETPGPLAYIAPTPAGQSAHH